MKKLLTPNASMCDKIFVATHEEGNMTRSDKTGNFPIKLSRGHNSTMIMHAQGADKTLQK